MQALVVAGGNNGSVNLASMLTLLPGAESWTSLAPLPRALYGARALIVGGRLRLTGGRDDGGSYRSEVSCYNLPLENYIIWRSYTHDVQRQLTHCSRSWNTTRLLGTPG